VLNSDILLLVKVRRDFSNQVASAIAETQALTAADSSYGKADLTLLFKMAAYEARKSQQQGRIFRVVSLVSFLCFLLPTCMNGLVIGIKYVERLMMYICLNLISIFRSIF